MAPGKTRRQPVYRRLSESPIWAANRRYYDRTGIDAWRTGTVPHYVTNNVPLATASLQLLPSSLQWKRQSLMRPLALFWRGR